MDHQPIDAVEERQEKVEKTEEKDNEKWTTGWKPKKKASPKLPIYLIDPAWLWKIWDFVQLFANDDEKTNLYPPTSGKATKRRLPTVSDTKSLPNAAAWHLMLMAAYRL